MMHLSRPFGLGMTRPGGRPAIQPQGTAWPGVANAEVIELYWRIDQYLHQRIETNGWAMGTVEQLAAYIARYEPGRRGFSAQSLWRMRPFFPAHPPDSKRGCGRKLGLLGVHAFLRRSNSIGRAVHQARQTRHGDRSSIGVPDQECAEGLAP
jgi:hypothetical protein